MTGTCSCVKEKMGCRTPFSYTRNSSLPTLLIGRLFRSITRTLSVTSSVLMVNRSPSLISAVVGSGDGVGLGLRIGGGGGAPSWGTVRRLVFVCGVAGCGCGFVEVSEWV